MAYLVVKYLLTAGLIVSASELAKRSDRLGAVILALPLMTVMTLFWMQADSQPAEKIANHAWYTFWYVLPTLPMFLVFPWLLERYGFAIAMAGLVSGTVACFIIFALVARLFGVDLL
ncbi:MAG TPA: DUF3147 family protein [Turneriella sp.]|nr:DUF3147 family protein [Turneriella sp.]HNA79212.1 DUF3147 family protein [Turneriella sp.]HNJ65470.1 DUF3147 family protein [Turneriella sp.]HNL12088.1 DUF3147 family protein [Turneriella sp.]HNL54490.1 DUF3147 family protein [Turneriella sp.]